MAQNFANYVARKTDGSLVRSDGSTVTNLFPSREDTFFARILGNSVDCYVMDLTGPNGTAVSYEWNAPGALAITNQVGGSLSYNGGKDAHIKYPNVSQQLRTISVTITDTARAKKTYSRTFLPTPIAVANGSDNRIHYTGLGDEDASHTVAFTPQFTGEVVVEWQQVGGPVIAGVAPRKIAVTAGTQVVDTLTYRVPATTARTTWTWVPVIYMGDNRIQVVCQDHSYTAVSTRVTAESQDLSVMDSKRPAWSTTRVESAPLASETDYAGAPTQAAIQAYFKAELDGSNGGNGLAANTQNYTASTFVVDSTSTPKERFGFHDQWGWRYIPDDWYKPGGRMIAMGIPIPEGAVWASGTDAHLMMVDPVANKVWESWLTYCGRENEWKAANLGRLDDYSASLARFQGTEGVTAAKVSWLPVMVTIAEARAAMTDIRLKGRAAWLADPNAVRINHKIYMAMKGARSGLVSWPASRTDGTSSNNAAPREGQTLRVKSSVDLTSSTFSGMKDFGIVLCRAFKEYGVIVLDTAGSTNIGFQSGLPEERRTGVNPYRDILDSTQFSADYSLLKLLGSDSWEAIKVDWLKP